MAFALSSEKKLKIYNKKKNLYGVDILLLNTEPVGFRFILLPASKNLTRHRR